MKIQRILYSTALCMALLTPVASASTVLVPNQITFTKMANIIAHVKVEKAESSWIDGRIITTITARVVEPLKGTQATEHITFTIPGGRVGNLEAISSGTPTIKQDEELVIYLENGNLGRKHLLGQAMGLYRVRYDNQIGQFMATRDVSKLGLVAASPDIKVEQIPRVREIKLQDLKKEIRQHIAASTGGEQ